MDGDVYLIYDAEDLAAFRDLVNGTNDKAAQPSANAKLMNDIDLGGAEKGSWTPIGNSLGSTYTGTFDGQNHTISGLYINTTGGYKGLFGFIGAVLDEENRQGSVQNLFVDGSVNSTGYVGGVAERTAARSPTATILAKSRARLSVALWGITLAASLKIAAIPAQSAPMAATPTWPVAL